MLNLIYNEKPDEAQRLFHGRGKSLKGLENLNIDYFPPVILLTCYQEYSLEILKNLEREIIEFFQGKIKTILVQKRYLPMAPTDVLYGDMVLEHICVEDDLKYAIKFGTNQNIGFFLDMKNGREMLKNFVQGKKVLNLFSYTCAFSVVAEKYGASGVVNIDMSKTALYRGKENHLLNNLKLNNVKFFAHDIFKSFGVCVLYP